jgi:hypothetical protein
MVISSEDLSTNNYEVYGVLNKDLSTNDIEMYQTTKKEINYKRVDEIVKDCSRFFPEVDKFVLWVLSCDYYLKEELKLDIEDKEEYKDLYEKCKNELKTKEYSVINISDVFMSH